MGPKLALRAEMCNEAVAINTDPAQSQQQPHMTSTQRPHAHAPNSLLLLPGRVRLPLRRLRLLQRALPPAQLLLQVDACLGCLSNV